MSNVGHTGTILHQLFLGTLLAVLAAGVPASRAIAQAETAEAPKPEKLFKSVEVMNITLHGPWRQIIKDKKNQDPYPGQLDYTDDQGQLVSVPVTVGRRGLTRQQVCKFPPIKLRFNPEDVKNTIFHGQKTLKLVTHCDLGERWEQYYAREYVLYQIYREITDLSFRARPLSVTYVDTVNDSSQKPRFAFLIEDDSDVAKRNDIKKIATPDVVPEQLNSEQSSRLALFEYMVANVDFDQTAGPKNDECCHNVRLFGLDPNANIYPIPYDFDGTGIVDTHYAAPNEFLPIKYVTQRLYRGFCAHNPSLEAVRQEFFGDEEAIYAIIRNESLLSENSKGDMLDFLQDSFATLRDDGKFNKEIIQKCRK